MNQIDRAREIIATYQKHGWQLRRALITKSTAAEVTATGATALAGATLLDSAIDALWFSRPSHHQRDAWELRLIAEMPYALFETVAADAPAEAREQVLKEMESRLQEYVKGGTGN